MNNVGDGNIVYFPGLVNRLLDKGMDALNDKKHKEALGYFSDILHHENKHPQAHLGYILSLFGLGQLSEAKTHCEQMMREGVGDYFEVLQIYLSILVQLSEFEKAAEMIEAVLQENKLPPDMAESFYQILEFSRKRMSEPKISEDPAPEKTTVDISKQRSLLNSSDIEKQWIAIQDLSESRQAEAIDLYKQFLKDKDKDPFLKSMVLQILNKKNIKEPVEIYKFGKHLNIHTAALGNMLTDNFFEEVKEVLSKSLQHENPTLYEMALQIWEHFVTAMFPVAITPRDENLWAAALFQVIHDLNGIDISNQHTAQIHSIELEQLLQAADQIKRVQYES